MYKFTKLLSKNILFALIFIVTLTVLITVLLSSYTSEKTKAHQKSIQEISQQFSVDVFNIEDVAIKFSAIVQSSEDYQILVVKNKNNVLHNYKNRQEQPLDFIFGERKTISAGKLPLQVQYKLDFSPLLNLVFQIYLAILGLVVICILVATKLNYRLQTSIFKIVSNQISEELAHINDPNFINQEKAQDDLFEIPALKEGIAQIKSLMTEQFQNTSSLEAEAHIDNLTGLENRNVFVQYYENTIKDESSTKFGVLLIVRCSELQTINQVHGYSSGDNYIVKVSDIIKNSLITLPSGKLFRLNSSDFAIILPNEKLKVAEDLAEQLMIKFNNYQQISDLDSVAYTGLVSFETSHPLGELLALADTGVSVAQTQKTNSWFSQKDVDILSDNSANFGSQNWRQEIDSVIENKNIKLLIQPILPSGRNSKVYGEVLARFLNANDDMLPTSTFIAMAEKLDKIIAIDQLIIETVINEITSKNLVDGSFGINISSRSINDEHFMIWLERKLLREPTAAPRLVFEIAEFGLQQNLKTAKRLVEVLHRVGSRVTVERFGVGLTSFKFFRDLTPDYIKMDSSYTRDIDDDKNNQYFLRLMVDLAHRLGINVLAESVESQEEKHTLEKLFIDGCQGYYVGRPSQLS